ncbi:MAG: response regulator [Treponema sp.]|jgi:PAS domain S-box-containing protein|nr:response regulator [Treponema sp.]
MAMEEKKFDSGAEEIVYLRKEVKRLARQLDFARDTLERIKVASLARENVNSILRNERIRQDHTMSLILQYTPDILIVFDENTCILYCADLFLQVTGIKHAGLVVGRHFREVFGRFVSKEKLDELVSIFKNSVRTGESRILEEKFNLSGKGEERDYEVLFTPMFNDSGKMDGSILILHDTTAIQNTIKRAEEASKAKSNFLANMSHEIRTPLNAIIGMANIGSADQSIEKKDYCLSRINGASTHLLNVINDILDMSKIEADKFELSITTFNFTAMLNKVVDVLSFKIEEKKLSFAVALDPAVPPVIVSDEQRLAQVITNLLSNAVKFTPEGGSVTLSAKLLEESAGDCVIEISVADTGIGISPEQEIKLFHSFEQADNSISRKYGGTGLGLVISKRIVELMNGKIWVNSQLGQGSSFIFDIHAGKGTNESAETETSINMRTPQDIAGCLAGYTILLAEDIEINREIVLSALESTGVLIDQAENGRDAFEKFSAAPENYDLILMDIQMPEMGGYESTRLIRAVDVEKAKTIPIIAMTANVFKEDIERCLGAGMNDHLGKPIDFNELIGTLRRYLPGKSQGNRGVCRSACPTAAYSPRRSEVDMTGTNK